MIHSLKITYKDPAISLDPLGPSSSTRLFVLNRKIIMKSYRIYLLASMDGTLSWESDWSRSTPDSSKVSLIAAILTKLLNFDLIIHMHHFSPPECDVPGKTFPLFCRLHEKRSRCVGRRLQRLWQDPQPAGVEVILGDHSAGKHERIGHELTSAAPL